jgi:hypothetical protein
VGFFNESRVYGVVDNYLRDLMRFKIHLIVPALNDASARIHEILAMGGIPLVPQSLRYHPALEGLSDSDVVYYSLSDVVDSSSVIAEGIDKFDSHGQRGIRARLHFGLANHSDFRLLKILKLASDYFGFEIL